MSFKRTSRLLASAAVTAGLAFGGLALTAPTATAAPKAPTAARATVNASYTCTNPLGGALPLLPASFQVPATFSLDTLPDFLTANLPVPAGIPIVGTLDFSQGGLFGILQSLGLTVQTTLNTVLGNVPGAGQIPINTIFTQFNNGIATLQGQLGSFIPTDAGSLPIPIPTSFDFGLIAPIFGALGVKCTLNAPTGGGSNPPIATIPVQKQGATVKAKGKKVVQAGKRALVKVKVKTSAGQKAVGIVTAKVGKKTLTKSLVNGKTKFKFKGLKVGKRKITFTYSGNSSTNGAAKKFTVRVVR